MLVIINTGNKLTITDKEIIFKIGDGMSCYDFTDVFGIGKCKTIQSDYDYFSEKYETKLSSAGIIYKYFYGELFDAYKFFENCEDEFVEEIYEKCFLLIDAIDSGSDTDISKNSFVKESLELVKSFNVTNKYPKNAETLFICVDKITVLLNNYMRNEVFSRYQKIKKIKELINESKEGILVTEDYIDPNDVVKLEKIYKKDIRFILFCYKPDYDVFIYSVPKSAGSLSFKTPLKKEWRCLMGEKAKIDDCIYVDRYGSKGINKTLGGALEMCRKSLENAKSQGQD